MTSVNATNLEVGHAYRARVRFKDQSGRWSHWSEAVEFIPTEPVSDELHRLRIAELNYNPHDALTQLGEPNVDNDEYEFVELVNTGQDRINLAGVRFVQQGEDRRAQGISFQFSDQELEPGARVVVVRDSLAFRARYGNDIRIAEGFGGTEQIANQYGGALSNGGETITLLDARGGVIQTLSYDDRDGWPDQADGNGSSLELMDVTADSNDPNSWRASETFGGSPGRVPHEPGSEVIINEVLARTDHPDVDRLELFNRSDADIDLQHWYVSDSAGDFFKFQFAQSTRLAAGEYLVLSQTELGFGFSGSRGDDAWLIEADASGRPLRLVDRVEFGGSGPGVSLGRAANAAQRLLPLSEPTFGGLNSDPVYGDANADGRFDQLDLDEVLSSQKYLTGIRAIFRDGDWNLDGVFDQFDIVLALQEARQNG